MILLLAACAAGPNEETLLDEVRVVAVVVEPPEVAPGEAATVTVTVADPLGEGPGALAWTCTNLGDGCLEAAEPGLGALTGEVEDGRLVATKTAPAALAGVVADGETVLPLPLWVLACVPGLCPLVDDPTADPEATAAFFADPFAGMEDLPMVGASLALGRVAISTRATPLANPVVTTDVTEVTAAPGEAVDLVFAVEGGATAYGYTTGGGFDMTEYPVKDGAVTLTWYAPEEPGEFRLYIVVNGEDGGSAIWEATATIPE